MSDFREATAGLSDDNLTYITETKEFTIIGYCDVWVSELTSGSVKLQIKFPGQGNWRNVPGEEYTEDTFKTIFVSEAGVKGKLVSSSYEIGAYMRLARHMNK